jgi:arginase
MPSPTAAHVDAALTDGAVVLVLGGDCTVELGTVAGTLVGSPHVGLVYIDLDTDLNTPASTQSGALDWMDVAHLLGVEGTVPALTTLGPGVPMLDPEQVLFFASDNITACERRLIDERGMAEVRCAEVAADPSGAARAVVDGWAPRFDRLLIHLDVDVLDFLDLPLAENTRRHRGLRFAQLMAALRTLLQAPNWVALTVTEVNPDHGEADGSTVRLFAAALAAALAGSSRFRSS